MGLQVIPQPLRSEKSKSEMTKIPVAQILQILHNARKSRRDDQRGARADSALG